MLTAASQPTAITIRHSRFAALTLAKLVASLALHPPSSATGNGGLRASPPPAAEPLLKEKPFGECICQLSTPAMPDYQAPVAADSAAGRRACAARPKGKYSRGRMALAPIRARRIFPATGAGGAAGGQGHSQFNSINFYVTNRFFVSFLTQERNVSPRPFVPRHS